jgi:hypothetical protein
LGDKGWGISNIPVLVTMLRSYSTFCARAAIKAIVMNTPLTRGCSKSACPLSVVIAVSLVFFGCTAEVASGDLDGRSHLILLAVSGQLVGAGGREVLRARV